MAYRSGRRGRRVEVFPAGRRWVRINPPAQRVRQSKGVARWAPPRIQPLLRGFIYKS